MKTEEILEFLGQKKFRPIAQVEEGGETIVISFQINEDPAQGVADQRDLVAEMWHLLSEDQSRISSVSFRLRNTKAEPFDFNIINSGGSRNVSVSRNGLMSLNLTGREARTLVLLSGQADNSLSQKIIIYGFYPDAPDEEKNYTIFYVRDLLECRLKK